MGKLNKAQSLEDWENMTALSWSYNALTDEQRAAWEKLKKTQWFRDAVRGTYKQRWDAVNAIYMAFLEGVRTHEKEEKYGI